MLRGNDTSWFRGYATDRMRIYPFPVEVGRPFPVEVWGMVGISARAIDPEITYPAFQNLVTKLNEVAPIPAARTDSQGIARNVLMGTSDEHQLLVDILSNASFIQLSRRERGILTNAIDAGIVVNGKSADDALNDAITRLEALQ